MSNDFFSASGNPATGSPGSSATIRAEFSAVKDAFDKMPALTGQGNKVVRINAAGNAMEATDTLTALTITTATINGGTINNTPIGGSAPAAGAFTTLSSTGAATLASGTVAGSAIVTLAATQTLTNKTLTTPVIAQISNTGTLTLPTSTDTLVGRNTTDTLTNKTINLSSNTLVATSAQLAAALTDETGSGAAVFATSPALAGTPTAPTAAAGTNTTQIATTAHVFAERTNTATLTNKTLTTPVLTNPSFSGTTANMGTVTTIDINGGTIDGTVIGGATRAAGNFTTLDANGNVTLGDASADTVTINGTVQPGVVISGSSSGAALQITQTGTGNALVVEDSASPDATPLVIDQSGFLVAGHDTAVINGLAAAGRVGAANNVANTGQGIQIAKYRATASLGADLEFVKSASSTLGANAVVASGHVIGDLWFNAADGTGYPTAAKISAVVDATPGTGSMPGRLVFSTTPDGAAIPVERMRIDSAGRVGFGTTTLATGFISVRPNQSDANLIYARPNIQAGVTAAVQFFSNPLIASGAALTSIEHFTASPSTFTGTATTQYGFHASSGMTNATNNYGFFGNIAAGTGRWNFYAAGTAANYFGGDTTINVNSTNAALRITQTGTGNTLVVEDSASPDSSPFIVNNNGVVLRGLTTARTNTINGFSAALQIEGATTDERVVAVTGRAADGVLNLGRQNGAANGDNTAVVSGNTLGVINFSGADGSGLIRAATIFAAVDGTPGTNDMPGRLVFSTTPSGSGTPVERLRIDSSGHVLIGTTTITNTRLGVRGATSDNTQNALLCKNSSDVDLLQVRNDGHVNLGAGKLIVDTDGTVTLAATSGLSIGRTSVTAPAASDGNVFSGTYTPTLTNGANVAVSAANTFQYVRVGNMVTVSGSLNIDPTSASVLTQLLISLPIASNLAATTQCCGTIHANGVVGSGVGGSIMGDAASDTALLRTTPPNDANASYSVHFAYQVI